jgi:hypothetical protein
VSGSSFVAGLDGANSGDRSARSPGSTAPVGVAACSVCCGAADDTAGPANAAARMTTASTTPRIVACERDPHPKSCPLVDDSNYRYGRFETR